jgi:hypothetical protein
MTTPRDDSIGSEDSVPALVALFQAERELFRVGHEYRDRGWSALVQFGKCRFDFRLRLVQ